MGVLKTGICNILPIPEMNAFLLHSLLNPFSCDRCTVNKYIHSAAVFVSVKR